MSIREITTGQDSFLDIIANLVGVLIILVVIVGAHAKQSWVKVSDDSALTSQIEKMVSDVQDFETTVTKLTADNHLLESTIANEAMIGNSLEQKRHRMLVQIQRVKAELERRRMLLDEHNRTIFDRNVKKASLESQLREFQRAAQAAKTIVKPKNEVIEHYPTPIAKTVFSDEVHFRLSNGRITYVPMDELIELMKSEWKIKAEKLKQSPTTLETVGPISGFRMQYELESVVVKRASDFGELAHQVVRLSRFVMVPIHRESGESIERAIQPNSEFRVIVDARPANKTTVSIWVYPDSFAEFNELKTWLRERGYQTASWPLSRGKLISGGPNGFRTSAH